MQDKNLILVDGYSFFFRAYFALKNIKKRSDGLAVNGVYGFTRMLIKLIIDLESTHIAIVFDTGGKNFRHDIFPDYKSNRPPVPADMIPQFPLLREVANAMGIKTIEKEGYEADDVIATLAKKAKLEGYKVLIISNDKDLAQLIDDNIFLYDVKENKKIGSDEILDKWGVRPEQLLGVLSLMGDASDNVPGIPSIGQKMATKLMKEYDNLENLINNIENVKPERIKIALRDNLDQLLLSRRLITLNDSLTVAVAIEDLVLKSFNPLKLRDFLYKMEFNSIAREIEKNFIDSGDDMLPISKNYKYKKISDINTLKKVCENLSKSNKLTFFSLKTENNDSCENVKTLCFSDENRGHIYFLCLINVNGTGDLFNSDNSNNNNVCLDFEGTIGYLKDIFENENILKVSYNVKKCIRILKKFNVNIVNFDDIGIMSYVLDNGKFNHTMANFIRRYLFSGSSIETSGLEKDSHILEQYENGKSLDSLEISDMFTFCCREIEIFKTILEMLDERLDNDSGLRELYETIEKPLVAILASMEYEGIRIDVTELKKLSDYFSQKIYEIENKIYKEIGQKFNINSPKQVGEILFEKMNLPNGKKSRNSGYYSTDTEILDDLYQKGFTIAGDILEYRHYMKLKSTYTDVLPKLIDKNGRVHTNYSNTYVITGRLSSSGPNLQNIPIKTEDGEKIRKTFIAKNGFSFIGADYSQIELRILAHYATVAQLLEDFKNNCDIHAETAKKIFKTTDVTLSMRRLAKIINFSIIYGTTPYGLAKRLTMSNDEAKNYIDDYFRIYPEVKEYMTRIKESAREKGFVKTIFNRVCYINLSSAREPQKSFLERLTINAPIQGTGADIIKKAMIKVSENIRDFDAIIILQVHDELLIEVNDSCVEEVKKIVKKTMENIVEFKIPFPVDIKVGKNWNEVH
jgi:DNA polymerase-1